MSYKKRLKNRAVVLTLERKMMDGVREIMTVSVVTQVRNQLVQIARVGLERTTRREVYVADDLVYANPSRDVAAFIRLFLKLVRPAFIFAL